MLGGGLDQNGGPRPATARRADAAAALAKADPELGTICSGRCAWLEPPPRRSEASWMKERLVRRGVAPDRVLEEDLSQDTVGNAVFVRLMHLATARPRTTYLMTSQGHMQRALYIFQSVFGPTWPIVPVVTDKGGGSMWEPLFLIEARSFFRGIAPGDIAAIADRLCERRPFYRAALSAVQRRGWPRYLR